MSETSSESILYFDGTCGFCSVVVRKAHPLHLKLGFVPLQTVDLQALGIDPTIAATKVPFRSSNGDVTYGHEAIAHALQTGNLVWSVLGTMMLVPPFSYLASITYGFVARHRHQLPGGTPACALDGTPHPKA